MFFVVSNWNNDVSWIEKYTKDYIIYDKSNTLLESEKVLKIENIGYNIHDIFHFIYNHYEDLPENIAFLEGNPFDHCNEEKFKRIINNKFFTPIESYEKDPENPAHIKCSDGGYMEINNSWYIQSHNSSHGLTCKYKSYDEFMNSIFKDYISSKWIRFSPGAQYIVERTRIQHYPKSFWKYLLNDISIPGKCTEAHIYERALWSIFSCCYTPREELK